MLNALYKVLTQLHQEAKEPFSGLGLLVCENLSDVPVYPIYKTEAKLTSDTLLDQLIEISSIKNTHHDGFLILSPTLELVRTAQYFYPKPISGIALDANKNYGARYFVAQVGSAIPNVICSAVIGNRYGVCLFKNGKEIKAL